MGRNTAPAIGLAAFLLARRDPMAVIGMFPSVLDVIENEKRFRDDIKRAARIAAGGANIVVIGIPPTRAETGYGYIEAGGESAKSLLHVRRFTEKPSAELAKQFVEAGNFFWNSGMFVWGARTLADALPGTFTQNCAVTVPDCRGLRHSQLREDIRPALSQVRGHQHRLRIA